MVSWLRPPKFACTSTPTVFVVGPNDHAPRCRAGAALESETTHAGAAADIAFGHRAGLRGIERGIHVFRLHVKAVHVVEHTVIGFCDERIGEPDVRDKRREILVAIHPAERGVAHHADAAGIRDQDRRLEKARLLHPMRAGHVAVAVEHVVARQTPDRTSAARQDGGDARADRALAFDELAFAANQRGEADFDAGHVGDGVERSGIRALEGNAQIPRADCTFLLARRSLSEGGTRRRRPRSQSSRNELRAQSGGTIRNLDQAFGSILGG